MLLPLGIGIEDDHAGGYDQAKVYSRRSGAIKVARSVLSDVNRRRVIIQDQEAVLHQQEKGPSIQ